MQIIQALNWAKIELKDIEEGANDALFLLSAISKKDKAILIAFGQNELSEQQWADYQSAIMQRKNHVPVSQILGIQPFWQWEFKVTDDVLTPRADSETLIEAILSDFSDKSQNYNIADFGTGSGCLLLSALSEYSQSTGYGVDINPKSLKIAQENENFIREQGAIFKKPHWVLGRWDALTPYAPFDIILANPPYIAESEIGDLLPEVLNHDPHIALFAKGEGLQAYNELFPLFKQILAPNGKAYVEHGYQQQDILVKLAVSYGLNIERKLFDLSGHPRGLVMSA